MLPQMKPQLPPGPPMGGPPMSMPQMAAGPMPPMMPSDNDGDESALLQQMLAADPDTLGQLLMQLLVQQGGPGAGFAPPPAPMPPGPQSPLSSAMMGGVY